MTCHDKKMKNNRKLYCRANEFVTKDFKKNSTDERAKTRKKKKD